MSPETLNAIAVALIVLAAPAATCFPIVYAFRPWRDSLIGRALMTKAVGVALLIDISIAYQFLGNDYPGRDYVRVGAYALIAVGIWFQFIAMIRAPHQAPKRARDSRS